ncbi:hypothetical protein KSC_099550 [Ktedonobacter sp. SOSP1-52]|uniref:hypothetical protein n=1 Tax=Ktedonobacter sp. SOSP1-52 TaxID=2778366 RepID=UPI001915ABA5|nr:hypothetical protein KSC_099550 [Ktedonobacter sp. SOSP1-52]
MVQQKELYHRLLTTTEHMLRQAEQVEHAIATRTQKTNQEKVQRLLAHVEQVVPLSTSEILYQLIED